MKKENNSPPPKSEAEVEEEIKRILFLYFPEKRYGVVTGGPAYKAVKELSSLLSAPSKGKEIEFGAYLLMETAGYNKETAMRESEKEYQQFLNTK